MRNGARFFRPRNFALGFGMYFIIVAFSAWTFASGLQGPWYGADLSRWLYTSYLLSSAILLVGLALLAFRIQASFDRRVVDVNDRIAELRDDPVVPRSLAVPAIAAGPASRAREADLDATVAGLVLLEQEAEAIVETGDMMSIVVESVSERTRTSDHEEDRLQRRRESMRVRQEYIMKFLSGPGVASASILAVSGALLPGTEAFLQSYHQVNTAILLAIAYSWPGIGAYIVASLYALFGALKTEQKKATS